MKKVMIMCFIVIPVFSMESDNQDAKESFEKKTDSFSEILDVSKWQEKTPLSPFNHPHVALGKRYLYDPNKSYSATEKYIDLTQNNLNLWVILHDGSHDYFNEEHDNSKHIKRAAAWYAWSSKKLAELLFCKWSGIGKGKVQVSVGDRLVEYLCSSNDYRNAEISLITHAYGGNIASYISQSCQFKDKPLENLMYFSCSPHFKSHYQPTHFKQLLYFFADDTITTILPRIDGEKAVAVIGKQALLVEGIQYVEKILTASNYIAIGSQSSAFIVPVWRFLRNTFFLYEGVDTVRKVLCTAEPNVFSPQDDRIVAGVCTFFNQEAAPSAEIMKAIEFLPQIWKSLHNDYVGHYVGHQLADIKKRNLERSLFDLHITQNGEEKDAVLTIAYEKYKRNKVKIPAKFNRLRVVEVTAGQLPMAQSELCPTSTLDDSGLLTAEKAISEARYSRVMAQAGNAAN